jgi:hypothetical protein
MAQTINTRVALEGDDEVTAQLNALGEQGEAAVQKISAAAAGAANAGAAGVGALKEAGAAAGAVATEAGAAVGKTMSDIEGAISGGVMSSIQGLSGASGLGGLVSILGEINPLVAGLAAGMTAVFAAGKLAADSTRELVNNAAALGVTTEQLEGLKFAAGQAGIAEDALTRLMAKSEATIGAARDALGKAADTASREQVANAEKAQIAQDKANLALQDGANKMQDLRDNTAKLTTGVAAASLAVTHLSAGSAGLAIAHQRVGEAQTALAANTRAIASEQAHAAVAQEDYNRALRGTPAAVGPAMSAVDQFIQSSGALNARDELTRFKALIDGLHAIPDHADMASLALKLFGRGWKDMSELIAEGTDVLDRNTAAFEASGVGMTKAEISMGILFDQSSKKLGDYFEAMSTVVGNIMGQVVRPMMDAISGFIADNNDLIREFAQGFVDIAVPALKAFGAAFALAFGTIAVVVRGVLAALNPLADAFNSVFGTRITGAGLLFLGLILQFTPAIGLMMRAVTGLWAAVGMLPSALTLVGTGVRVLMGVFTAFGGAGAIALGLLALGIVYLYTHWDQVSAAFKADWAGLGEVWAALCGLIKDTWNDTTTDIENNGGIIVKSIQAIVDMAHVAYIALTALYDAGAKLRAMTDAAGITKPGSASGGSTMAPGAVPMAAGGLIRGPGSGSSDSILARVSDGEFIVRDAAVGHYGVGFLNAINSLRLLPSFAMGGLVGALSSISPSSRAIGVSSGLAAGQTGHPVYLTIGAETFHMTANADVADQLTRHAQTSAMRSAGTKPSWYSG